MKNIITLVAVATLAGTASAHTQSAVHFHDQAWIAVGVVGVFIALGAAWLIRR